MSTQPKIIAHRGASGSAPENTLAAVQKALELGADLIEVDVHLSQDGEVVVIHDATLGRSTNGKGVVQEFTLSQLKKLDAGSSFAPSFAGERIPTLEEVLRLVNGKAGVLVEIKRGLRRLYQGIEEKVIATIDRCQARDWVILQSFEPEVVRKLHQLDPDLEHHKLVAWHLPRLWLYHDGKFRMGSIFKFPFVQAVNPWHKTLKPPMIAEAHRRGLKVFTYTVNQEEDMIRCLELGVDGIITNFPEKLKSLLESRN